MGHILIIEDDVEVRELLAIILKRAGHLVTEAGDGRDGIHAFRTNPADLIITDLIMPRQEGLETIVQLRQEFPNLKIIAISGGNPGGKDNYLQAARLCGASKIFRKPFENSEIIAAVEELLANG
jgi:CheY-like chemotaxis protein